jgi:hypothetical protein
MEGLFKAQMKIVADTPGGLDATIRAYERAKDKTFPIEGREYLERVWREGLMTLSPRPEDSMRLLPLATPFGDRILRMG